LDEIIGIGWVAGEAIGEVVDLATVNTSDFFPGKW
jgi:hypothetical protein